MVKRVSMPLFKVCLVAFLALSVMMVVVQAVGLIAGDAGLVSGVVGALGMPMTVAAGVTGLLGFAMSYVFRWESDGED